MNLYGTLTTVEYSPELTIAEPITLEQARVFLGLPLIPLMSAGREAEIGVMITAARELAEEEWGGDIALKQYRLTLDCWPECEIPLRFPLASVDLVRYRDSAGAWTTLAAYITDTAKAPGVIMPLYGETWPTATLWPSSAIEIYFSSGFVDQSKIPQKLLQGMQVLVSHWFTVKLPVETLAAEAVEIPWTVSRLLRGTPRP